MRAAIGSLLAAGALLFGMSAAASAPGFQVSTAMWLNFDQGSQNQLALTIPDRLGGGVRTTRLVGGVHAILTYNLLDFFSPDGVNVDATVDEIRIAGENFELFEDAPDSATGTLCVIGDPNGAGSGHLLLPVVGWPTVSAQFNTVTFLTGALGQFLPDGIKLAAQTQAPLQVDLRTLFANKFAGGPVKVQASATGTVPKGTPFLQGSAFALNVTLVNSFSPPPDDPLLDECAAFLASRS
jgi:hypothetical protein